MKITKDHLPAILFVSVALIFAAFLPKSDATERDPEVEMLRSVIRDTQMYVAQCANKEEAANAARSVLCKMHEGDCTKENVDPLGLGHVDPQDYLN